MAYEVAQTLRAPLDVMIVRKLGVPGWPELAMGAIASGGVRVVNDAVVQSASIPPALMEQTAAMEAQELQRREVAYRGHPGAPQVKDQILILVDDGIATGATIRAAALALRPQRPARLIIAVPTAAADACTMLEPLVDELVALSKPISFRAVGQWYRDFSQISDAEVKRLLARANGRAEARSLDPQ